MLDYGYIRDASSTKPIGLGVMLYYNKALHPNTQNNR